MKVFTLTLATVLIIGSSNAAVKLRKLEQDLALKESSDQDQIADDVNAEVDVNKKEKEVHKRGVFHYGNLAGHSNVWPKSYASHYGYGLHLPAVSPFSATPLAASHLHSPALLKYNSGLHYKTFASPVVVPSGPGVSSFGATPLPGFAPHGHYAASATPYVLRPGNAIVQSYSVNYPQHHRHAAVPVKPVASFAAVQPVQHNFQAVQPTQHNFQAVQPIQHNFQAVQPIQHNFQAVQPIQHNFQAVQPVQPAFQPVHHHVQAIQPVEAVQHVQPVQSVVQVQQHLKPTFNYDLISQQYPSYFQGTYFQPASAVPAIPQVPSVPVVPQVPVISHAPAQPVFPEIPSFPNPPVFPNIPASPAVPGIPQVPAVPAVPSIPQNLSPQFPFSSFFPVNVQPPLQQQPPSFVSFNPASHQPGLVPVAGTPNHSNPDFGSAEASPQIPVQAKPNPEPEQPQPTQQPWKPVLYEPPTVESNLSRPSHTLQPPYGNSPAEGYLPPASATNERLQQQEYSINGQLFDNLSDADIQNIFQQASLAAQHDHNHAHTVHTYNSRY